VTDVVVDGVSRGPVSSWTFANVTANHTLSAAFGPLVPPTLSIVASGLGGIEIAWPDTHSGQLLWSGSVDSAADWRPVGLQPVHAGGWYTVTVMPGPDTTFFRLSN
jgi:hypothetical protein